MKAAATMPRATISVALKCPSLADADEMSANNDASTTAMAARHGEVAKVALMAAIHLFRAISVADFTMADDWPRMVFAMPARFRHAHQCSSTHAMRADAMVLRWRRNWPMIVP